MSEFIDRYEEIWGSNPTILLEKYDYHLELTKRLDSLNAEMFSKENLYEIVLWKVSRYPYVDDALLAELRTIAKIQQGKHRDAETTLARLLRSSGIRLAMASTILRFLNPRAFQIIDDRTYRVLLSGEDKYPDKPATVTAKYIERSIAVYWKYLDELIKIASPNLPFMNADRILYQLDIELGHKIGARPASISEI